jgi:hypothetical protein
MRLRLCTDRDVPARVIVKGSHCVSAETIRRHYRNIQSFPLFGGILAGRRLSKSRHCIHEQHSFSPN